MANSNTVNPVVKNPDNKKNGIDTFRVIAAFLIIAIHTYPLTSISGTADFVLTRIIARVAVPFFFMVTGYFLLPKTLEKDEYNYHRIIKSVIKTLRLYGLAILIYLPINIYNGYFNLTVNGNNSLANGIMKIIGIVKDLLLGETFYHLWYLPASILGLLIIYLLSRIIDKKLLIIVSILLYGVGLLGDSYYGLTERIPVLHNLFDLLFHVFDYTRNGLFFAPIYLVLGTRIARNERNNKRNEWKGVVIGSLLSFLLLITEASLLHYYKIPRHDSMYIMLLPLMYYLFKLLLHCKGRASKTLRNLSMILYIIHPLCIIAVRGGAKVLHLERYFISNSVLHYLSVSLLSLAISLVFVYFLNKRKNTNFQQGRAWIEVDLNHLQANATTLQAILPKKCKVMAVVKANAYGHGDVKVAKVMSKIGINSFAVATLEEGVHLRKHGIKGDILILGYTHQEEFPLLVTYHLTQTIVDYDYASLLNQYGKKIDAHIKIDTGMHRLGESYDHITNILNMFQLEHIVIKGMYTHLCVADQLNESDVSYTNNQIAHFYQTIEAVQLSGYNPGQLHIQSSYGVVNYPELQCDFARIGIALYGVLSTDYDKTKTSIHLLPVMSVKARIVVIKTIQKGEPVSYGRQFIADSNKRIAVVSIGYADGIPRNLSDGNVLVNGRRAPIIGRICMDQFVIDVTGIPNVHQDLIVTIIGKDGDEVITAEEVARKAGTITNELLSRFGSRLNRCYTTDYSSLSDK